MKWLSQGKTNTLFPLLLALLLVVQNVIFNAWVNLPRSTEFSYLLLESFTLGVLLYGPALLLGKRTRFFYLFSATFFTSLIFVSQYIYHSFYGGFMQASALRYAHQVGAEWSTILTLITPRIAFFFLAPLTVFALALFDKTRVIFEDRLSARTKFISAGIIIIFVLLGYGALLAMGGDLWKKLSNPAQTLHDINSFVFSQNQTIQRTGITNYYIGDLIGSALRRAHITPEDIAFVETRIASRSQHTPNKYTGIAKGKNLIFLQIESLDAGVIGQKIGDKEVTPNLNKLAKEGLYFDNYYTQIGPGNTADAEFVTLTSLYPLTNTVAFVDFAHNTFHSLPNVLVANGYHTYALHGDVPNFWNRANIYPGLGYENQISKADFTETEEGFETLDDDDFLRETAEKMSTFTHPFMATAITLSSHTPFIVPEKYHELVFPADTTLTEKQQAYLHSVHYVDAAIGAFIADIKKRGIYDDSVIAIFGDHGSFTDTEAQRSIALNKTPRGLTNSQVPLIILSKDLNKTLRGKNATPGSHLDLFPTIANLLGVEIPQTIFGNDLLDPKHAVMTHRDPYTDIITNILTPTLSYTSSDSGLFPEGTCLDIMSKKIIPIQSCNELYERQAENIRASDLIVKGNLLKRLTLTTSK